MEKELLFSKHHGLGNDFLVLMDMTRSSVLSRGEIVALLDRRRGIGADGLIRATPAPANSKSVATMELFNSDGSRAEMSGNGIRCLAQALIDAGVAPHGQFSVDTDAGRIEIFWSGEPGAIAAVISAGMGLPNMQESGERLVGGRAYAVALVNIGNPHLVLLSKEELSESELGAIEIEKLGPELEAEYPGGINVEWIAANSNRREMQLRVWERGAGITDACGTGSTASAFAANRLGLVGDDVVVHNPGGDLQVRVERDQCYLTGPVHKVADVIVSFAQLSAMSEIVT